jgi:hypothetical protein
MRYPISAAIGAGAAAVLLLVAISTAAVRCTTKLAEPIARTRLPRCYPSPLLGSKPFTDVASLALLLWECTSRRKPSLLQMEQDCRAQLA